MKKIPDLCRLANQGGEYDIRRMKKYWRMASAVSIALASPAAASAQGAYLFVWAGGTTGNEEIATIDASPASATYGRVLASASTGTVGAPHHTEHALGATGHLLANDFHAGRTWLFDLNDPLHPRVMTSFGDVAGFSHPHSFIRLANGRVLSTFEYRPEAVAPSSAHESISTPSAAGSICFATSIASAREQRS
jgi:hypothetical protein